MDFKYDRLEDKVELYSSPAAKIRHRPFKTFNNVITIEVTSYNDQRLNPSQSFKEVLTMEYSELTGMSATELQQLRRKLAKRANQRMVRLEHSTSSITGEPYHAGAYDIAQDYLRIIGRGSRFSESINYEKDNSFRLKKEILELDTFLHSKTSTISGNRTAEKKRIDTFTGSEWGLDEKTVASKEFYDFLQSSAYDYFLANSFTSEQLIDIYDTFRDAGANASKIQEAIDDFKQQIQDENANSKNGKQVPVGLKDFINYINDNTGRKLAEDDVLNIIS